MPDADEEENDDDDNKVVVFRSLVDEPSSKPRRRATYIADAEERWWWWWCVSVKPRSHTEKETRRDEQLRNAHQTPTPNNVVKPREEETPRKSTP
mmetsp:Transcript_8306/g.23765  ORF Transcript_8306/g.23765 Transcript_8306/m.23765 type:complete len:95 (+) Transcript_8306:2002-2286(+)